MKLKELSLSERPRERLLSKGPSALSTPELVAILIRTGSARKNVVETACELLAEAGGLTVLSSMSVEDMTRVGGVGLDKAATVAAAFELGRRFMAENIVRRKVTSSSDVYAVMSPLLKGADHEECWILYLNRANMVIGKDIVSSGGMASTVVDVPSIVRRAIAKKASSMVMIHNHPSGNPTPSDDDVRRTVELRKAAVACGLSLLDHVIVADSSYYSFSDEFVSPV